MEYPEAFVAKVKAEYPEWQELHRKLDSGDVFVGRYLDDNRHFEMSPTAIVIAFNDGRGHEVREAAEKAVRREQLYSEWSELYDAQR